MQSEAFFLSMDGGRRGERFCLYHGPRQGTPSAAFLYVHPFAEEMNKSRRMASLQARAFAEAGCAVLQIDLLGCGDSSGDFGDAGWSDWVGDVVEAAAWLRGRAPAPLWLWGHRAGCLLASAAAPMTAGPCNFLFWQPMTSGKTALQQFLRLKLAGDMLDGKEKGAMSALRQQLETQGAIDVAGYRLSARLASGLEAATLAGPTSATRLEWIEVSPRTDAALPPASQRSVEAWRDAGFVAKAQLVAGPAFWQTTEIEDAPALVAATTLACLAPAEAEVA